MTDESEENALTLMGTPIPGQAEVPSTHMPQPAHLRDWADGSANRVIAADADPLELPRLAGTAENRDADTTAAMREVYRAVLANMADTTDLDAQDADRRYRNGEIDAGERDQALMTAAEAAGDKDKHQSVSRINRALRIAHGAVLLWLERLDQGVSAEALESGPEYSSKMDGEKTPQGENNSNGPADAIAAERPSYPTKDGYKIGCLMPENHNSGRDDTPSAWVLNGYDGLIKVGCPICEQALGQKTARTTLEQRARKAHPQALEVGDSGKSESKAPKESKDVPKWTLVSPVPDDAGVPSFVHPTLARQPDQTWAYRNADGALTGYVARFDPTGDEAEKTVKPYVYAVNQNGEHQWRWLTPNVRGIYGLDRVVARPDADIYWHEGEKAADAGAELLPRAVHIAQAGGAQAIKKGGYEQLEEYLHAGRAVYICPDNDSTGARAAGEVAQILDGLGADNLYLVDPPVEAKPKWDIADALGAWDTGDAQAWIADNARDASEEIGGPEAVTDDDDQVTAARKISRKYGATLLGGKFVLIDRYWDPAMREWRHAFLRYDEIRAQYSLLPEIVVGYKRNGDPIMREPMEIWKHSPVRRSVTYRGVTFVPGAATTVDGYYNLWRGWPYEPSNDTSGAGCQLFLDHIRNVVARRDDHLYRWCLKWMAHKVQHPASKIEIAIVAQGKQGTGKGVWARHFGELFGSSFLQVHDPQHVVGRFTEHLSQCVLLNADEAFFAGSPSEARKLKGVITEPTITAEAKFRDPVKMPNYLDLMITGNDDHIVPEVVGGRRYAVMEISEERKEDHEYFKAIEQEMRNGGYEALMGYLLAHEDPEINLHKIPETNARLQQMAYSLEGPIAWFKDLIQDESLEDLIPEGAEPDRKTEAERWSDWVPVPRAAIYDAYQEYAKHRPGYPASPESFWRELRKAVPSIDTAEKKRTGFGPSYGNRPKVAMMPPKETAVAEIEAYLGAPLDKFDPERAP